jgi:hypothetical protein
MWIRLAYPTIVLHFKPCVRALLQGDPYRAATVKGANAGHQSLSAQYIGVAISGGA